MVTAISKVCALSNCLGKCGLEKQILLQVQEMSESLQLKKPSHVASEYRVTRLGYGIRSMLRQSWEAASQGVSSIKSLPICVVAIHPSL